jgi:prophage regulatory protein
MKQTSNPVAQPNRILRVHDVMAVTGLRRTSLYEMVRQNRFPTPVKLATRAVGWRETDVVAWMDSLLPAKGVN